MRNFDTRASIKYKIFPTQDDYELYKRDESIVYEPQQESKCYLDVIVKILVLLLVVIPLVFLAGTHFYPKLLSHKKSLYVAITQFRPYGNDQYVCVSHHLDPNESYYVTKFETSDKNAAAHHMLLYACENPAFEHDKVWSCGHMADEKTAIKGVKKLPKGSICGGGDSEIIFAEAMQAGSYSMPKGVSFKLGHDSKYKYLTLQIHYANVDKFTKNRNLFDNSGLKLTLAEKPTNYTAHVMLLATGGGWIPKHSNLTNLDILCTILAPNEKISMKPFAFRTHAHSLGKLISGYVINQTNNSDWKLIARKSPQLRQTFYPILRENITVRNMDQIAARCSYQNPTSRTVYIGGTKEDEMCNLYLMYYTETGSKMWQRCQENWQPFYNSPNLRPILNESVHLTNSEKEEVKKEQQNHHH